MGYVNVRNVGDMQFKLNKRIWDHLEIGIHTNTLRQMFFKKEQGGHLNDVNDVILVK